jgi:urea transporter
MNLRFVMYTDKNVAQTMKAVNERLHAPGTKSRPQMDGWVEKSGRFAMAVTSPVYGRFPRKTHLHAKAERQGGTTVVSGTVSGGLPRNRQFIIVAIMVVLGLVALSQGSAIFCIVAVAVGLALPIPLQGDYENSEILLTELQKALKARFAPPRN